MTKSKLIELLEMIDKIETPSKEPFLDYIIDVLQKDKRDDPKYVREEFEMSGNESELIAKRKHPLYKLIKYVIDEYDRDENLESGDCIIQRNSDGKYFCHSFYGPVDCEILCGGNQMLKFRETFRHISLKIEYV